MFLSDHLLWALAQSVFQKQTQEESTLSSLGSAYLLPEPLVSDQDHDIMAQADIVHKGADSTLFHLTIYFPFICLSMQPHTNNLTDPSIAMDDITDIDSDSDILSGSDEAVDDIRDIDSNPDILSGPEEEEESDIASFNEDDMYGSDNEDDVIVSHRESDDDVLVEIQTSLVAMVRHSSHQSILGL